MSIGIVSVLALIGAVFFVVVTNNRSKEEFDAKLAVSNPISQRTQSEKTVETRAPVLTGAVVPDVGATGGPKNIAVPDISTSGNPTNKSSFRSFSLVASGGKFIPDTIIANQGDTIDITMTAIDRDYDFTQPDFGFKVQVPRGDAKKIQFTASATGKFTYYCAVCGGPFKGPLGYIVIVSK